MSGAALWAKLQAEGLAEGEMPAAETARSPWYVRVILGIAGWIGALFLIGFVGAGFAFVLENAAPGIILGGLCCAGAFVMFKQFDDNDFMEQFALVISLVGQVLIGFGLSDFLPMERAPFYIAMAIVEGALAFLIPNFLHRVLTSGGAAIALALAVKLLELHGFAAPLLCVGLAWIWLEPRLWAGSGTLWRPVGYGLMLAVLLVEMFRMFAMDEWVTGASRVGDWLALWGPMIGRSLTAAVLVWVAIRLVAREGHGPGSMTGMAAIGAAVLFGLLALNAPGLTTALLVLLLGFAAGNRILMGLGIVCLFLFVGHFYYSLHATLLEKSGMLALTGVLLLGAWLLLRRGTPATEAAHA